MYLISGQASSFDQLWTDCSLRSMERAMPHHLKARQTQWDTRLEIADLYVFRGEVGTVFILTINSVISGESVPTGFQPEAQHLIKIDLDGDAVEDLTYRLTFAERDGAGRQAVELRRLSGREAHSPTALGTVIAGGASGAVIAGVANVRLWAGLASDPFYIDRTVGTAVASAFKAGSRVDLSGWHADKAENLFEGATVSAIVLEVPDTEITWRLRETPSEAPNGDFTWRLRPERRINVWASTLLPSASGEWRPTSRAGHPMIQSIFYADESEEASRYNATAPADDLANYGERFARMVAAVVAARGTVADSGAYGETVAALLLPDMLPYVLGSPACYGFAGHNGRALTDNTPDVMFSLVTNSALTCGLTRESGAGKLRATFPYIAPAPTQEGAPRDQ
jgi:hypothetical protein